MWIKPGQHGTSARPLPGSHPSSPSSVWPTISGSLSARDHQLAARHERYGHAGDPWKNGP